MVPFTTITCNNCYTMYKLHHNYETVFYLVFLCVPALLQYTCTCTCTYVHVLYLFADKLEVTLCSTYWGADNCVGNYTYAYIKALLVSMGVGELLIKQTGSIIRSILKKTEHCHLCTHQTLINCLQDCNKRHLLLTAIKAHCEISPPGCYYLPTCYIQVLHFRRMDDSEESTQPWQQYSRDPIIVSGTRLIQPQGLSLSIHLRSANGHQNYSGNLTGTFAIITLFFTVAPAPSSSVYTVQYMYVGALSGSSTLILISI